MLLKKIVSALKGIALEILFVVVVLGAAYGLCSLGAWGVQ